VRHIVSGSLVFGFPILTCAYVQVTAENDRLQLGINCH